MNRFNITHFTYGSNDESKHFLPSEYFYFVRISFMPSVFTHLPLLNLQLCPDLLEIYQKEQNLQNAMAKVSLSESSYLIIKK